MRTVICLLALTFGAALGYQYRLRYYPTGSNCAGSEPRWDVSAGPGECFAMPGEENSRRWAVFPVPGSRTIAEGRSWEGTVCQGTYVKYPMTVNACNDDGWARLLTIVGEQPTVDYRFQAYAGPKCAGKALVEKVLPEGKCVGSLFNLTSFLIARGSCGDYVRLQHWIGDFAGLCPEHSPLLLSNSLELGVCESLSAASSVMVTPVNH